MAFRHVTCVIAVCDLCGISEDDDGGVQHFDTEANALDCIIEDPTEFPYAWYQRPGGQLVCWRRDEVHDRAREEDGVLLHQPGPDAMVVTFGRHDFDPDVLEAAGALTRLF